LDPSFSPISSPLSTIKDLWNDTKDIAMDVGSGVADATGAAVGAGAGGLAGALTGNPAGVAAGMFAGGSAGAGAGSAAASALKEKLRQKYGVGDGSFNATDVAIDGTIGALMPGALNVAGRAIKGVSKAVPRAYSKALGITPDQLRTIVDHPDAIRAVGEDGITSRLDGIKSKVKETIDAETKRLSDQFDALKGKGFTVNVAEAKRIFQTELQKLKQMVDEGLPTDAAMAQLKELQSAFDDNFTKTIQANKTDNPIIAKMFGKGQLRQEIPDEIPASAAMRLQQLLLNQNAKFSAVPGATLGRSRDNLVERVAKQSSGKINEALESATDGVSSTLKMDWQDLIRFSKEVGPKFKDPAATESALDAYSKGSSDVFTELLQKLQKKQGSTFIDDEMNLIGAYKYLNPAKREGWQGAADAVGGRTPLEKILGAAGLSAGYVAGGPMAGLAAGWVGKSAGRALTGKRAIRAFVGSQRLTEKGAKKLMQTLENNPELLNLIYGGVTPGAQEAVEDARY
jgi:hypothetical protein